MKKAVIVLPIYNEKHNLEKLINEIFDQEKNSPGWRYIILLATDQRSTDGTIELSKKLEEKNPKIHQLIVGPGLGTALIEGHIYAIKKFNPQALAQLDGDGQVDAEIIPRLLNTLEEGYNLAIGSRFVKGGKNKLSFSRRLYSNGSSWFCRIVMGPWKIGEFTNSARAFTPSLFKKINLERLPWQEQTFIVQPAFLNEAILAGAKYKEIPLIFKNRAEGYSKMKVFNYTYDVISYTIDARLKRFGINFPLFQYSRKIKTIVKFGLVGLAGTIVDFTFYNIFINYFYLKPATSKGFSTEIAIFNNFLLNNIWTFKHRKLKNTLWQRMGIFNLVSLGGLAIGVLIIKLLHMLYGDGSTSIFGVKLAFYNIYFFVTIPPVMIWNFTVNHFVTWRKEED